MNRRSTSGAAPDIADFTVLAGVSAADARYVGIGRIRRNASGFHNPENFVTMFMLDRGSFGPNLPWAA